MSKVLGIDFGLKRIGLALGYEEFKMSFPYKTLEKKDNESLFIELKEIVKKEDIKKNSNRYTKVFKWRGIFNYQTGKKFY